MQAFTLYRVAFAVPPVAPRPVQPVSFAPMIVSVGFTFVALPSIGRAGLNVAAPVSLVHVGLAAAAPPGAAAMIPAGTISAAATRRPANLRIQRTPWFGKRSPQGKGTIAPNSYRPLDFGLMTVRLRSFGLVVAVLLV